MFSDNLIELRKYHNLSQEELAEKIGVSRQTLSKYETGESYPDIEKCKALADLFEVSMDALVTGAGTFGAAARKAYLWNCKGGRQGTDSHPGKGQEDS